jgi:aminoglycoside 6'-N-acetyltransferase
MTHPEEGTAQCPRGPAASGGPGIIELKGERLAMRTLIAADAPALRTMRAEPEVAAWWQDAAGDWPLSDDPDTTRLTILVAGEVAGMIQFWEETDPDYRHASIDVFLATGRHRRGLGTEAVVILADHLISHRGHHRLTIDPAADNAIAIRCYEKAGFRRVGIMRAYWRDRLAGRWRDGLLMEMVA